MDKVNEYLRRADECRELADGAMTTDIRGHYRCLAAIWEKLADERKTFFVEGPTKLADTALERRRRPSNQNS